MIDLLLGDITKARGFDAIVNAANSTLLGGGGVDGAIHRAAGAKLLEECQQLNGCKTGEAKITKAYDLPCEYVIHTVGPIWAGGEYEEDKKLSSCYKNVLDLALKWEIQKIAFPSISTGKYCFPIEKAAQIAFVTINGFLQEYPNSFERICFVLFDERTKAIYGNIRETMRKRLKNSLI